MNLLRALLPVLQAWRFDTAAGRLQEQPAVRSLDEGSGCEVEGLG